MLSLRGIEIRTRIGISQQERASAQRVLVSVEFPVDAAAAANQDIMTVDYAVVREDVLSLAPGERRTIETLAEETAALLLRRHNLPWVTVEVRKFPFPDAQEASLRITRRP